MTATRIEHRALVANALVCSVTIVLGGCRAPEASRAAPDSTLAPVGGVIHDETPGSTDGVFQVDLDTDGSRDGATIRHRGKVIASMDELRDLYVRTRAEVASAGGHFRVVVTATSATPWNNVMRIANLCKREGLPTEDFEIGFASPSH